MRSYAKVIERSEIKTGARDANAAARAQLDDQSALLRDGAVGEKTIRLEVGSRNITGEIDLGSDGWRFLEQAIALWRLVDENRAREIEAIKDRRRPFTQISGNVMASQKLEFLRKMAPKRAADVVDRLRGGAAPTAADW